MPLARVVGQFDQFQVCAFFSGIEPIRWLEGLLPTAIVGGVNIWHVLRVVALANGSSQPCVLL